MKNEERRREGEDLSTLSTPDNDPLAVMLQQQIERDRAFEEDDDWWMTICKVYIL